jgi:hypothetical protein
MNFFYLFPSDNRSIKLPIIIDIKGKLFISDDLESIIFYETLEWDCKYLITITTSSGLPLTNNGVPFTPIKFIIISYNYILDNLNSQFSIPGATNCTYPYSGELILDGDDIINWPSLKISIEDIIRSSDIIKYDENIASNIDLY